MTESLIAAIFPGQGSQAVGMGRELAERYAMARDTFAEADALLGFSLSAISLEGPADELKRTSIAQPALVTASTAYWRVLRTQGFAADAVAGHSLGEYSALVAAGAISFPDAVRLVHKRGQLMEAAAVSAPGGMAAVIGLDDDAVEALCAELAAEHGTLVPANYNAPGQVVVSGVAEAIAAVRVAGKARGAKVIPLAVSGGFHSPLMREAAEQFAVMLDAVEIMAPSIPIVQNVTAQPTTDPAAIRDALRKQITGSVRWVQSVQALRALGVGRFVEVGPGNVLTGLVQRTWSDAILLPVETLLAE